VSSSRPTAERALADLQRLVRRQPTGTEKPAGTRLLPTELTGGEKKYIYPLAEEIKAVEATTAAVSADLRFEHLRDPADAVWYFVAECSTDRSTDYVPAFVGSHGREPTDAACYIPVEFLTIREERELPGTRFLPVTHPDIPQQPAPWFVLEPPVGCVAAVRVRGTNYGRMAERARATASHTLRLLRIAVRGYPGPSNTQLRFGLATGYAFDAKLTGWNQRDDIAYDLTLGADLTQVLENPVMALPAEPRTDIERKALVAARWMEQAFLTGDELVALLYRFFALEALLGRKSEGLKAHGLAFRQMVLGHAVTGSFGHPNATLLLYAKIRSGAVHGEEVPGVSTAIVNNVERGVLETLGQYLTFARDRGLSKRSRLLDALDNHPDRQEMIVWLREYGGQDWSKYLDSMEWPQHGC